MQVVLAAVLVLVSMNILDGAGQEEQADSNSRSSDTGRCAR